MVNAIFITAKEQMCGKSFSVDVQNLLLTYCVSNLKVNQGREHGFLLREGNGVMLYTVVEQRTLQCYKSLHDNHSDQVQNGSNWSILVHLHCWVDYWEHILFDFCSFYNQQIHLVKLPLISFWGIGNYL